MEQHGEIPELIIRDELTINLISGQVFLRDTDLLLTRKEFALLLLFMVNKGRFLDTEYLYEKVWGQSLMSNENAVRVAVSRLRKKMDNGQVNIIYDKDDGYCLKS